MVKEGEFYGEDVNKNKINFFIATCLSDKPYLCCVKMQEKK